MSLGINEFPSTPVTPYETFRSKVKDGDVLICSGTGIFSAMIQQATRSVWSHVGFVLRIASIDRIMLLESLEPEGVRTVRLSKYLENYANNNKPYPGGLAIIRHKQFHTAVDKKGLGELAQFAVDRFGYAYDKRQIAKIAARILASRVPFTPRQRRKIAVTDEYICSEYTARCYAAAGITIPWNRKGFIAPSDFAADPNFELKAVLQRP